MQIIELPDEFGFEITFAAGTPDASHVTRAATLVIDAFNDLDRYLARNAGRSLIAHTHLQRFETGSIKVYLRKTLEAIDDEALSSGEIKRVVGTFLVKAKYAVLRWLQENEELQDKEDIETLLRDVNEVGRETGMAEFSDYGYPVPDPFLRFALQMSHALEIMQPGETVSLLGGGTGPVLASVASVDPKLTEFYAAQEIVDERTLIAQIAALSTNYDERWQLKHANELFSIQPPTDATFRRLNLRREDIRRGDHLKVTIRVRTLYDSSHAVLREEHRLMQLLDYFPYGKAEGMSTLEPA